MNKDRKKRGMTMAEMLIVVAIIGVLAGVSFIAVNVHQRNLALLERDEIAKEIFIAAQNHLTSAFGEGFLEAEDTSESENADTSYYVVNHGDKFTGNSLLDLMLPFGSIDETVRAGGNYIIRYQKKTGLVRDVFYCSNSEGRFDHSFFDDGDTYDKVKASTSDKSSRRNYVKGSVLGWYGAAAAAELPELELEEPRIEVINAEKLYVKITDPNYGTDGASLRLIIEGNNSQEQHYFTIDHASTEEYDVVLDEIIETRAPNAIKGGGHFCNLLFDDGRINSFIPGENLTIRAIAYSNSNKANTPYSNRVTTNSLFGDESTETTANISNIRHLENLDKSISNLGFNNSSQIPIDIGMAIQKKKLDWDSDDENYWKEASITKYTSVEKTDKGCFMPVNTSLDSGDEFIYDGGGYSISNITVKSAEKAGLFGKPAITEIKNLELLNFSILSTSESVGMLAGALKNTEVTNVLARNTRQKDSSYNGENLNVSTVAGSSGGLVGECEGCTIKYCAAAVWVKGKNAGGLIGEVTGNDTMVTGCYSGGHINETGKYSETEYNVTGSATAGGLVGVAGSSTIVYSYTTCSVSAEGGSSANVGGLIGSSSEEGTITNCYCTGLVDIDDGNDNAFIGDGLPSISDCAYFQIINEVIQRDASARVTDIIYKKPGNASVHALDEDVFTYNTFVGSSDDWNKASAYNKDLRKYYSGKYNLKTVEQLGEHVEDDYFVKTHYGDWPSPEVFVLNEAS